MSILLSPNYPNQIDLSTTMQAACAGMTDSSIRCISGAINNVYPHVRMKAKITVSGTAGAFLRFYFLSLIDAANSIWTDGITTSQLATATNTYTLYSARSFRVIRAQPGSGVVYVDEDLFNLVGYLPQYYAIAMENLTGTTLTSTAGSHKLFLAPMTFEYL